MDLPQISLCHAHHLLSIAAARWMIGYRE